MPLDIWDDDDEWLDIGPADLDRGVERIDADLPISIGRGARDGARGLDIWDWPEQARAQGRGRGPGVYREDLPDEAQGRRARGLRLHDRRGPPDDRGRPRR